MVVGTCRLTLLVPGAHTLKEKRRVLSSLKARLRQRFNIALAEVDSQDLWQRAELGVACVGTDRRRAEQVLHQLVEFVEREGDVTLAEQAADYYVATR